MVQDSSENKPQISYELQKSHNIPENVTMSQVINYSAEQRLREQQIQTQLEGFKVEYKTLTDKIVESNAESKNLVGVVDLIKQAPTLTDKIKATGNIVDLVPFVGTVKKRLFGTYIGSDIGGALADQYLTLQALNERIHEFVYNDKTGLRNNVRQIKETLRDSQAHYLGHNQRLEELLTSEQTTRNSIKPQVDEFEKKYNTSFDDIDFDKLDLEDSKQYLECAKVVDGLSITQQNIKDTKKSLEILAKLVEGKKIELGTTASLLYIGEKAYTNIDATLQQAEGGIESIAQFGEIQQLLSQAGSEMTGFKSNFNDAVKLTAEQTRQLSEMGDDLVPNSIYNLETLVVAGDNIRQTADNILLHHGMEGQQELKNTLTQLTQDTKPQPVTKIENKVIESDIIDQ